VSTASKRIAPLLGLFIVVSLLVSACQAASSNDLLGDIKARGTIRVSTDPNYAPQSVLVKDQQRAANTKCAADELTANQMEGQTGTLSLLVTGAAAGTLASAQ
jgi:hypothetical protein